MEHQAAPATASTASAATRPNGLRPLNQLVVNHEGRKPLFTPRDKHAADKHAAARPAASAQSSPRLGQGRPAVEAANRTAAGLGLARRTQSESKPVAGDSQLSPGGTRIPRPSSSASSSSFHRRRPISLAEAFRLAEGEEVEARRAQALDGSPSPAPRSWRARSAQDENRPPRLLTHDRLDSKTREQSSAAQSSLSKQKAQSAPTIPAQRTVALAAPATRLQSSLLGRRLSPIRHEKLSPPLPDQHMGTDGHDIPDLVPGIEDMPLPSVETTDGHLKRSPRKTNGFPSPEKSFAWEVEADFTAGDLQVSDSPRIRVESNRPFASRPSLVSTTDRNSIRSPPRLTHRGSTNTKLDEIRAREKAVDAQMPIPDRNQPRPRNTKLDEIRQREADGLSRRAYASVRLEEIREQNATSRSVSPEEARPRSGSQSLRQDRPLNTPGGGPDRRPAMRSKPALEDGGEPISDTPVTVYKNRRATERGAEGDAMEDAAEKSPSNKRDSHDVLRRLARATSASPAPEPDASGQPPPPPRRVTDGDEARPKPSALARSPDKSKKTAAAGLSKDKDGSRPTVGFKGLRRSESVETKGKRSGAHSEADPTDRIEAEKLLFAPHDNQSERGSVRAPSPPSSSEDEPAEATPRADKHDFQMPTPRVTGAYVETPATAKVEKMVDHVDEEAGRADRDAAAVLGRRRRDQDSASDPGTSDYNRDGDVGLSTAAALRRRRRSRSLPRRRRPLRNSAKLPSVRGDLLELQRIHNIDDSTIDDFEGILLGRKVRDLLRDDDDDDDEGTGSSSDERPLVKRESGSSADSGEAEAKKKYGTKETALFDRMSRSLYAGLWNIRTAKQGIERLEDQFSHAGTRLEPGEADAAKRRLDDADGAKQQPSKDDGAKKEPGDGDGAKKRVSNADAARKRASAADAAEKAASEAAAAVAQAPAEAKVRCAACLAPPGAEAVTYVRLPVPRLYHTKPRVRLSLLGLLLVAAALWLALETAVCARYCRPATCSSGECVFSFDDPTFGAALPVKLDQWTTGGRGRSLLRRAADEALDLAADMEDAALGRSIADVPLRGMSHAQKRRHRRRLAKRGLLPSPPPPDAAPPELRAKWEAWRRARRARDQAQGARDMGFDADDDAAAAIGRDQRVG